MLRVLLLLLLLLLLLHVFTPSSSRGLRPGFLSFGALWSLQKALRAIIFLKIYFACVVRLIHLACVKRLSWWGSLPKKYILKIITKINKNYILHWIYFYTNIRIFKKHDIFLLLNCVGYGIIYHTDTDTPGSHFHVRNLQSCNNFTK